MIGVLPRSWPSRGEAPDQVRDETSCGARAVMVTDAVSRPGLDPGSLVARPRIKSGAGWHGGLLL